MQLIQPIENKVPIGTELTISFSDGINKYSATGGTTNGEFITAKDLTNSLEVRVYTENSKTIDA
ncbi:hypothetical protein MUJ63_10145 [Lachnospiraceae bacterium NSJ-143]|nr:hypothetical protein [Lachnospiraceae bacterium NSJ-143]